MKSRSMTRGQFLGSLGKGALAAAAGSMSFGAASHADEAPKMQALEEPPLPWRLTPEGRLNPKMKSVAGVAYDSKGRLYIAGASEIRIFSTSGKQEGRIPTSGPARCVALAPDETVYAGQRTRVESFDPEGRPLRSWGEDGRGTGQFSFITAIAAASDFLFVADSGNRRIQRFAADGDYVDALTGYKIPAGNPECQAPEATKGATVAPGYLIPSGYFDLAFDAQGRLHVGHTGCHRVERYGPDGRLAGWWGRFGPNREDFCGCCNPTNIALFSDGRVATAEKGVPRLKVYDPGGKLLAWLGEENFPGNSAGMDLAVDAEGRIAMAEPIGREVRFYRLEANGRRAKA